MISDMISDYRLLIISTKYITNEHWCNACKLVQYSLIRCHHAANAAPANIVRN